MWLLLLIGIHHGSRMMVYRLCCQQVTLYFTLENAIVLVFPMLILNNILGILSDDAAVTSAVVAVALAVVHYHICIAKQLANTAEQKQQ